MTPVITRIGERGDLARLFYIFNEDGFMKYMHRDGTWHDHCGEENIYSTVKEARASSSSVFPSTSSAI